MGWLTGLLDWVLSLFVSSENPQVKSVRDVTVQLCGFLPTVECVVALLAANPASATAIMIAKKICAAVSLPRPVTAMGEAPIIVDGVVIQGQFVNRGEK